MALGAGLGVSGRQAPDYVKELERAGLITVAAIYKERWKIELFFKALKQNLTVQTFAGTSENAPAFRFGQP